MAVVGAVGQAAAGRGAVTVAAWPAQGAGPLAGVVVPARARAGAALRRGGVRAALRQPATVGALRRA